MSKTIPLLGSWRLVSWENRDDDGTVSYPLGPDAAGLIHYLEDGYMSVAVMAADRAPFAAADLLSGSRHEKAAAFESFVAYGGRFEWLGDRVVHLVEVSSFPNWVGSRQERFAAFEGNRLTLSTAPMALAGRARTAQLIWERSDGRP